MSAAAPDRYAVLGNPVEHSQSPFIHAAFARQTGEAVDYERLLCPLDGFEAARARLRRRAAARGCNVTVPFKFEALRAGARARSARAALAGAANMLRFDAATAGSPTTPTASAWCATSSTTPASRSPAGACC